MPELATRSFPQLLAEQARAAQAEAPAGRALDFSRGSIFRAIATGFAVLAMWLQGMVLRTLANTRAATSGGADLDSWMADYVLARNPGTRAGGLVTFGRFTPGLPAIVPAGTTQVRTGDGAWTYRVAADSAHPLWLPLQRAYSMPAGTQSADLPVEALLVGAGGNADANTVTLLATSLPGVDFVRNAVRLTGGEEAETDDAFRVRFRAYIASLPSAVTPAIDFAIRSVQPGLTWVPLRNQLPDGTTAAAHFTAVVDDGSGAPTPALLARVSAAVETVRALGVTYAVVAPERLPANVSMALRLNRDADAPSAIARVTDAIEAHINGLPLGAGLSFTRLSLIAYTVAPEVTNVLQVSLNGAQLDILGSARQAIRAGTMNVTASFDPLPSVATA